MINPASAYPHRIDPMIFFQDVDLEKSEIMAEYNDLVARGRYSDAANFIKGQDICGYFADYFNAIENRICSLQAYLLAVGPKQPFVLSDSEPAANANNKTIWI